MERIIVSENFRLSKTNSHFEMKFSEKIEMRKAYEASHPEVEKSRIVLCRFLSNSRLVSNRSLSNPVELSNLVERSMSNSVEGSNKDRIALSNVVELP